MSQRRRHSAAFKAKVGEKAIKKAFGPWIDEEAYLVAGTSRKGGKRQCRNV